jgi:hypothetical protein
MLAEPSMSVPFDNPKPNVVITIFQIFNRAGESWSKTDCAYFPYFSVFYRLALGLSRLNRQFCDDTKCD